MRGARKRSSQLGLTLLEFVLATIFVGVLVAYAADRIARVRMAIEQAAVERHVAHMREGLAIRFAELAASGRLRELPAMVGDNPLEGPVVPADYADVHELPPDSAREPGQWYFDKALGAAVYVPRFPQALEWPDGEPRVLRWQVRPDWKDVDADGEYDPATDRARGLSLHRLDAARWR